MLAPELQPLALLGLGFLLGLRHAMDPDHVVAVTAIAARTRRALPAALLGRPSSASLAAPAVQRAASLGVCVSVGSVALASRLGQRSGVSPGACPAQRLSVPRKRSV